MSCEVTINKQVRSLSKDEAKSLLLDFWYNASDEIVAAGIQAMIDALPEREHPDLLSDLDKGLLPVR